MAYSDNAAIATGGDAQRFYPDADGALCGSRRSHALPGQSRDTQSSDRGCAFASAATGAGGEIRDEGATGRGAVPKSGLTGFDVQLASADCRSRGRPRLRMLATWAHCVGARHHDSGPDRRCRVQCQFGRPNLGGYFRTFEQKLGDTVYGYHKPIMIAGASARCLTPTFTRSRSRRARC